MSTSKDDFLVFETDFKSSLVLDLLFLRDDDTDWYNGTLSTSTDKNRGFNEIGTHLHLKITEIGLIIKYKYIRSEYGYLLSFS